MGYQTILYNVEQGVARLVMNRPAVRNGLNEQMTLELLDATRRAAADVAVRAVLLTGAGSAFCSGADLGSVNSRADPQLRAAQAETARAFMRDAINPLVSALYHCEKPVVAAVNGAAVGGGIGLALAADVVIAAESARFIAKFVPQLALIPDLGCTWMLPRLIGRARALGLTLFGEALSAREAQSWGLIWRCYADEELPAAATRLTTALADGPAFALGALKLAMKQSAQHDYDQQLQTEMELSAQCAGSADFAEAIAAFMEKRAPRFGGTDRAKG